MRKLRDVAVNFYLLFEFSLLFICFYNQIYFCIYLLHLISVNLFCKRKSMMLERAFI